MLSQSNSAGRTPLTSKRKITNTATYNGRRFHLHQIVTSVQVGSEKQEDWIVVGLEDGLKLASPDFEQKMQYSPGEVPESIDPQYAETGEPVFGY